MIADKRVLILLSLFLAFLSGLSGWLWWVNTQTEQTPTALKQGEADFTMQSVFASQYNPQGLLNYQLQAQQLVHYPVDQTARLQVLALTQGQAVRPDVGVVTVKAEQGYLDYVRNTIEVRGQINAVRPATAALPNAQFNAQQLQIDLQKKQLSSPNPVAMQHGNARIQAGSMDYQHATQQWVLSGKVKAQYDPIPD